MAAYKAIFFCILVLSIPVLEARKSGGGGGFGSRGSSAARTGSAAGGGSFSPNRGGNTGGGFNHGGGQNFGNQPNYGNRGGFNQQPNYGNRGGFNQQPHYNYPPNFQQQGWNRSPGFSNTGSGLGSASRGSTFKHALAGAAIGTIGGLLVFEAGKAIINSATTPFHHGGRDYYFDQQNYRGPSNVPRCSVPLQTLINTNTPTSAEGNSTSSDQTLQNLQYKDGTKPKEVVWSCNMGEICCGTDCCPAPQSNNQFSNGAGHSGGSNAGWIVLLIILVLLISCCLGCFCVYKFCRSTIENFLPSRNNNNQGYYDDGAPKYDYNGQPSQSYPMNSYPPQYPQQQYPPQQNFGYPPNPGPRY